MQPMLYPLARFESSPVALGCMHFGGNWRLDEPCDEESFRRAREATSTALECGISFFDHADIYCAGKSEEVFGRILRELEVDRDSIIIQSKCGIRMRGDPHPDSPHRYDFSAQHILRSVEGSLARLGTDYLDILLLHRPDLLAEPEEIAAAFSELKAAGKVRWFGVSNHVPAQMELLRAALGDEPLIANQVEINPLKTSLLDAGIISRGREPAIGFHADGTLEYHQLNGIVTQAWAPLAYGYLSGRKADSDDPRIQPLSATVAAIAENHRVPAEAVLVAWLRRHPARIHPVVGTRDPERIRAAVAGARLDLSREEWYRIYLGGRGHSLP